MTIEEMREIIASIIASNKAQEERLTKFQASTEAFQASTEAFQASTEAFRASTEAFKASSEAESRAMREEFRQMQQADKERIAETDRQLRELGKQLRELGKQIGGLSNKFGTFTEGLALPSVQRLLFERFGVEDFMPRRRKRIGSEMLEIDALGVVNGERNEGYVVEIKSHLRKEAVDQILGILTRFRDLFPEYKHLRLFGIIVAADSTEEALREAQDAGLYVIAFDDDIMRFYDKEPFTPKTY